MDDEKVLRRPIGWWLKEADARLDAAFDNALADHDVDRRAWQVLATLARSSTPRADIVTTLAAFDQPAAVESVVDNLLSRGWLAEPDSVLRLTPNGVRKQESLAPLVEQVRNKVTGALPGDEYATLVRLLARLVAGLTESTR
ncbi:MAG: hypothetical protein GEU96_08910 [Propionibacteriales bacterium]|nr:hypothetical protein [Propionibacteriales bacterium]